ncbi:unnamed protein product [Pocillopora meandrina]|uniref:Endonuclease/exonuclease/phosphatase domain-containing protein n=1 Tax=Pocillopora meandrina TaxID=46732 RepID=A0AAU9WQN0_9CNID|nr:unnamed protein product [Pocillopora meandrina]
MGGDFNCPLNPAYDKKGGNLNQRKSVVECIDCLQNELDLVDIWRIENPNTKSYTWSQNSPKIFCRLDYWLISNNLNDLVKSTGIIPAIRTDHDAITLDIEELETELKGSGYWKMNCSLLIDEEYVNSVTEMIPIWTAEGRKVLSDDRSTWDWIKYNIKHHAILHSKKKAKERDVEEKTLQKELNKAKEASLNFIERLDSIKRLIIGLSIFDKVTIIKSFLIPKFVYVCSLPPTPNEMVKQLNQLLFKFLLKGTDKVTRLSTINDYGEGGLKMIDSESMVKALRLAWLKRIFNSNDGTWKRYLQHQLKTFGGLFFLNCNYDVNDYTITSQFYRELLLWWSQFRETFATDLNWTNIIWNNKEIRIDKKPIYYKKYFDSGITQIHDLRLDLNINDSFSYVSNKIRKISFLQWAGLRHSIPDFLKDDRD